MRVCACVCVCAEVKCYALSSMGRVLKSVFVFYAILETIVLLRLVVHAPPAAAVGLHIETPTVIMPRNNFVVKLTSATFGKKSLTPKLYAKLPNGKYTLVDASHPPLPSTVLFVLTAPKSLVKSSPKTAATNWCFECRRDFFTPTVQQLLIDDTGKYTMACSKHDFVIFRTSNKSLPQSQLCKCRGKRPKEGCATDDEGSMSSSDSDSE